MPAKNYSKWVIVYNGPVWGLHAPADWACIPETIHAKTIKNTSDNSQHALYYGRQVRREPADCSESCDHRPDLALLLEGMLTVIS